MDLITRDAEDDDFKLISAMRYDPERGWKRTLPDPEATTCPVLLLSYHRDRLVAAAEAFEWTNAAEALKQPDSLQRILAQCEESIKAANPNRSPSDKSAYKIRLVLSRDASLKVETAPVGQRPFDILDVSRISPRSLTTWPTAYAPILSMYIDTAPTPSSAFTSYKTTRRDHYAAARERVGIVSATAPEEVILYNETGEITEASLRNICIWREPSWVTPPLESGCLGGVVRRWMIESGRVREARIMKEDLIDGEWVLTSNGVEGCSLGRVVKTPKRK